MVSGERGVDHGVTRVTDVPRFLGVKSQRLDRRGHTGLNRVRRRALLDRVRRHVLLFERAPHRGCFLMILSTLARHDPR